MQNKNPFDLLMLVLIVVAIILILVDIHLRINKIEEGLEDLKSQGVEKIHVGSEEFKIVSPGSVKFEINIDCSRLSNQLNGNLEDIIIFYPEESIKLCKDNFPELFQETNLKFGGS